MREFAPRADRRVSRRGIASGVAVAAVIALPQLAVAQPEASSFQPTGHSAVEHYADVAGNRHGFAFYSGAPAAEIEKRLPPRVRLTGCLEHRVPGQDPAPGTADILIDVRETAMVERPDLGVLRSAVVMTCIETPDDWPLQDPSNEGAFKALGLPSSPDVLILDSWVDSAAWRTSMERFGFLPKEGVIEVHDMGATWSVTVSEPGAPQGAHILHGTFPTPVPTGVRGAGFAGCTGVQQVGRFFEWDPRSATVAGVRFLSSVDRVGVTTPNRRIYVCPGSSGFTWHGDSLTTLLGRPLPPSLAGSEPQEAGTFQRWEISQAKLVGRGDATAHRAQP